MQLRSLDHKSEDVLVRLHQLLDCRRLLMTNRSVVDLNECKSQKSKSGYIVPTQLFILDRLRNRAFCPRLKIDVASTLTILSPGCSICVAGPEGATSSTVTTVDQP